jgi:hypothetical protein
VEFIVSLHMWVCFIFCLEDTNASACCYQVFYYINWYQNQIIWIMAD